MAMLFSKAIAQFYIPPSSVWGLGFLHILPTLVTICLFKIVAILVSVKWYLPVVWMCLSRVAHGVEQLFLCLLAIYVSVLNDCLFRYNVVLKTKLLFCIWLSILSGTSLGLQGVPCKKSPPPTLVWGSQSSACSLQPSSRRFLHT